MKKASFTLYLFAVLLVCSPLAASPLMPMVFGCMSEVLVEGDKAKRLFERANPRYLSHHILLGGDPSVGRLGRRSFFIHFGARSYFSCSAPDVDNWVDHLTCICPDFRDNLSLSQWAYKPLRSDRPIEDDYEIALKILYRDHLKTMSEEKQSVWLQRAYRDGFWHPDNFDPNSHTNFTGRKWRPSLPEFP